MPQDPIRSKQLGEPLPMPEPDVPEDIPTNKKILDKKYSPHQKYREYYASNGMHDQSAVLPMLGDTLDPQFPEEAYATQGEWMDTDAARALVDTFAEAKLPFPFINDFLGDPEVRARAAQWVAGLEVTYYATGKSESLLTLIDLENEDFGALDAADFETMSTTVKAYNAWQSYLDQVHKQAEEAATADLIKSIQLAQAQELDFFMESTGEVLSPAQLSELLNKPLPPEVQQMVDEAAPRGSLIPGMEGSIWGGSGEAADMERIITYNQLLSAELEKMVEEHFNRFIQQDRAAELGLPVPDQWKPRTVLDYEQATRNALAAERAWAPPPPPRTPGGAVLGALGSVARGAGGMVSGVKHIPDALGWLFDRGIQAVTPGGLDPKGTYANYDPEVIKWLAPFSADALDAQQNEQLEATRAEREATLLDPSSPDYLRNMALMGSASFDELLFTEPALANQFILASGNSLELARALFTAGAYEENPEFAQVLEDRAEQQIDMEISRLAEADFTPGDKLMEVLATYGRLVPGTISTGAALLMVGDEDFRDDLMAGNLGDAYAQIASHENRPSSVFGHEGTFLGLVEDLGMGIIADPTTWFFAPGRAAQAYNQFAKVDNILAWVDKTAVGRQIFDDTFNLVNRSFLTTLGTRGGAERAGLLWGMPLDLRVSFMNAAKAGNRVMAKEVFTEAMLQGWKPGKSNMLLNAVHTGRILEDAARSASPKALTRFMSRQNTNTAFVLSSSVGYDEMMMAFARLLKPEQFIPFMDKMDKLMMESVTKAQTLLAEATKVLDDAVGAKTLVNRLVMGRVRPVGEKIQLLGHTYDDMNAAVLGVRQMADDLATTGADPATIQELLDVADGMADAQIHLSGALTADEWAKIDDILLQSPEDFAKKFDSATPLPNTRPTAPGPFPTGSFPNPAAMERLPLSPHTAPPGVTEEVLYTGQAGDKVVFTGTLDQGEFVYIDARGNDVAIMVVTGDTGRGAARAPQSVWLAGNAPEFGSRAAGALLRAAKQKLGARYVGSHYVNILNKMDAAGPKMANKLHRIATSDLHSQLAQPALRTLGHKLQQKVYTAQRSVQIAARTRAYKDVRTAALKGLEDVVVADEALRKIPGLVEDILDPQGAVIGAKIDWTMLKPYVAKTPGEARPSMPEIPSTIPGQVTPKFDETVRAMVGGFEDDAVLRLPVSTLDIVMARGAAYQAMNPDLWKGLNAKQVLAKMSKIHEDKFLPGGRLAGYSARRKALYLRYHVALNRMFNNYALQQVRRAIHTVNSVWVLDKVLRPATAMSVTADEALRIIHQLGLRETVPKWAADKAANIAYGFMRRFGHLDDIPTEDLSKFAKTVVNRVNSWKNNIPKHLANQHQNVMAQRGVAEVISYGSPGFYEHASDYTRRFLEDEGFRLWLSGDKDAWTAYLKDLKRSGHLRGINVTVTTDTGKTYTRIATQEDLEGIWENIFQTLFLRKADPSEYAEMRRAWQQVAKRVHDARFGTGALTDDLYRLPDRVLKRIGDVPIWGKGGNPIARKVEDMFESQYAYREGFLARYARTAERKRLEALFANRGIKVLEGAELQAFLEREGLALNSLGAHITDEMLLKHGVVSRNYIDNMAEFEAQRMIEDMLYKWHLSSPLGKASSHVYPFGKPWADMWGFWLKRLIERPILRFGNPQNMHNPAARIMDEMLNTYPLIAPNRSAALMSRMAHTNFNLENEDLKFELRGPFNLLRPVFGSEIRLGGVDAGSLFFLPTGGDNPYYSMVPGLRPLPLLIADMALPDPDADPEGWYNSLNAIRPLIDPGLAAAPDTPFAQRMLQGGWFAMIFDTASTILHGTSSQGMTPGLGGTGRTYTPLQREVVRTVMAALATPGEMENILLMGSPEFDSIYENSEGREAVGETFIDAFVDDYITQARSRQLVGQTARQAIPFKFDTSLGFDDSLQTWLSAGDKFPEILYTPRMRMQLEAAGENGDEELYSAAVQMARSKFYQLPYDERLNMLLLYPGMAVASVPTYLYNEQLRDVFPGNSMGVPYAWQTGLLAPDGALPPEAALDAYNEAVAAGALIPRSAKSATLLALGNYFNSFDKAHDVAYAEVINAINTRILGEGAPVGYYSTSWRTNFGDEEFNDQLLTEELPANLDAITPLLRTLGIQLPIGSTVQDLVIALQNNKGRYVNHPLFNAATQEVAVQGGARSEAEKNALDTIKRLGFKNQFSWGAGYETLPNLVLAAYETMNDAIEVNGMTNRGSQALINDFRAKFGAMAVTYDTGGGEWGRMWNDLWAGTYGPYPVGFEFPNPPGVDPETGREVHPSKLPGAYQPYIADVIDGDSLKIQRREAGDRVVDLPPDESGMSQGREVRRGPRIGLPFLPWKIDLNSIAGANLEQVAPAHEVRLISNRAAELTSKDPATLQQAQEDHTRLFDLLKNAPPGTIWLVPDPTNFGNVDRYGRQLVWLWVNGTWYYDKTAQWATDY